MTKSQNQKVFSTEFFTAIKYICYLLGRFFFTERNKKFPYPFIYLKPDKGTPFGRASS